MIKPSLCRIGQLSLTFTLCVWAMLAHSAALRPPSVPLVACDPYFSIWSPADQLYGADTTHWTGKPHRLSSLVKVDGQSFRLMGQSPSDLPGMEQKSVTVLPTRTIYEFAGQGISLSLTFLTPALPEDMDVLSRPVTYLTWSARSTDGRSHAVSIYFDAGHEIAVNVPTQAVTWKQEKLGKVSALVCGSVEQPILMKSGDDLRIDWGYLYLAAAQGNVTQQGIATDRESAHKAFIAGKPIPLASGKSPGQPAVGSLVLEMPRVSSQSVSRWIMLAYDDIFSIQYMKKNLRPYWRRNGWDAADLLRASAKEYEALTQRCVRFDEELMADLTRAGGEEYAKICALAYRQCFAAGKFVADDKGQPLQFSKENHSNGCIGTSDVFYPMAPQFLLFGPTLAKSFVVPFMNYAASDRWKFPFAPHDLGTYPKANGQVYGGGERTEENQMPVEESGNLLILMAAIAEMEGNADFAARYWDRLEQWAEYLKAKGFDPENQLCTDDFAGHLAHNVNLSAKAICGLGSFAKLCQMRGQTAKADEYSKLAHEFAQRWVKEARDGDHYRLAFDKPGTWSQKYNIIWDRILGLNLFPAEVARLEMDYYKKIQNEYGLPLDNRQPYTKLDWILWTATLTQDREDFQALVAPVFRFLNETPDRSPMTDWYQTRDAKKVGFTARPVVGGVFVQMLYDKPAWQKYAMRDRTKAKNWAPMPQPPKTVAVLPAADTQAATWRYTTAAPPQDWFAPAFNDSSWSEGKSGFGTQGTPSAVVGTRWNTDKIWIRREVQWNGPKPRNLHAWLHHDEDVEVYINGVHAISAHGYVSGYDVFPLTKAGARAWRPGRNVIAIHCRQTGGGQYIDMGLVDLRN